MPHATELEHGVDGEKVSSMMIQMSDEEGGREMQRKTLTESDLAFVNGLCKDPKLNGVIGTVEQYYPDLDRWAFLPMHRNMSEPVRIRSENLVHIARFEEWRSGTVQCVPRYGFTAILRYATSYDSFPKFDVAKEINSICEKYHVQLDDRTGELEDLQTSVVTHAMYGQAAILRAGEDSLDEKGKTAILFRRTMLNNTIFACNEALRDGFISAGGTIPDDFILDPNPAETYAEQLSDTRMATFLLFFGADMTFSLHGSALTKKHLRTLVTELVSPRKTL